MPLSTHPDMHREGFIRLALVLPFLNFLNDRGIDPCRALEKVGLSADQVNDTDVYVHSELVFGLLNEFSELAGDRYLGLRVGESFDLQGWPPFAMALQSATTLFEFLTNFVRLVPQESSSVRHSLIVEAERAIYRISRLQEPAVAPVQVAGFGAAVYVRLLQSVTGETWDPGKVAWETRYVEGLPPRYSGVETRFLPDPGMQLSFPVDWLSCDVARMSEHTPQEPLSLDEEVTIVGALRSILRDKLDEPDMGPENTADLLGIRTDRLLKALKHNCTTLPREIKRLKIDLAQDLLRSSDKTATEIGAKLGYADKAHFTRFFKSQTGMTPSEFRAKPS